MMNYDENELDRDLSALKEEVPPMPEGLHEAWMTQIAAQSRFVPTPRKQPLHRQIIRGMAAAAAVVFVAAGATLTASRTPVTANGLSTAEYKQSSVYDAANETALYGSRSIGAGQSSTAYDGGVMLTADMAAAKESETQERKIIRSVSLTIATDAFSDTLAGLKSACETGGGWIESITESGEDGDKRAWMTMRLPAESLDVFLEGAGSAGRITNRSESAQDVTNPYYDTQARLESQKTLLARLQELVAMAESLEDILALEAQMADTQYQIDQLQESLQRTDRQVDYATVDITLREETPAGQAADAQLSLMERLAAALRMGGEVFVSFLQDAAVWIVCAIPFAAVVAVLWLVWRIVRRKRK